MSIQQVRRNPNFPFQLVVDVGSFRSVLVSDAGKSLGRIESDSGAWLNLSKAIEMKTKLETVGNSAQVGKAQEMVTELLNSLQA